MTVITANSLFISVIHFRYVHLIKLKTLSTFACLGCCLTSLLDLANSGTLAQEETFPVRCSVLSRASCIAHRVTRPLRLIAH